MADNTLILHLPLDEVRYSQQNSTASTPNVAAPQSSARVFGQAKIIHDPEIGSCMLFDGQDDYVELASLESLTFADGLTAMAWVRFDATPTYSRMFDLTIVPNSVTNLIWLGNEATGDDLCFEINGKRLIAEHAIALGEWHHVAVTYGPDGSQALFIDGKSIVSQNVDVQIANTQWKTGYVGRSSWTADALFRGAIADLRMYNRALPAAEINSISLKDKSSTALHRETALLKVDLYTSIDDDHKPIIYIEDDNRSEPLEVALTNPSNKPIAFVVIDTPTEEDFHVQLRFRRNVIAPSVFARLQAAPQKEVDGWRYAIGTTGDGREDYISFVKKDAPDFTLAKGDTQRIRLPEFSAAAQGGARNTRIEVRFRTAPQDPGSVIRHMEIQSHLGLKTIPLVAQIKGSNTVLNHDTTENELTIEILCAQRDRSVQLVRGTRFELIVDDTLMVNQTLSAATSVKGLQVETGQPGQGVKVITFEVQSAQLQIDNNHSITIDITHWITKAPAGTHNLLLRYENIPGYWSGTWLLPVQFSPLVMRDENVGIGTDAPQAPLHVTGDTLIEGNLNIGGDHNGAITVRHINGKNDTANTFDTLYLNYDTGKDVEIGREETPADLHVHGRVQDQTGFVMPVGAILAYGGSAAPAGWLLCDGAVIPPGQKYEDLRQVLRPKYEDLRQVPEQINVPDLRGRFIVGAGQGLGLSSYSLNHQSGEEKHTLTVDEMPKHSHSGKTNSDGAHQHTEQRNHRADNDDNELWGNYIGINGHDNGNYRKNENGGIAISESGSSHQHNFSTDQKGENQPHNNLPPYYALTYIIKY